MENIDDYMPLSNDWNKERLETLKKLYPDLFANEGRVNIREIAKLMDYASISETERYEFRWFGKSNAKREAFTPTDATLIYDEARSVNPTESENLIIEGENLAVLKLLSNGYREQIKCIYIDPPYNTGNDFVYSDKFNQDKKEYWEDAEMTENGYKIDTNVETDGRFHSNWLNMMYSRLLIARQLLREDGVIFISIDDNEVFHLRKLCDEVFGEENFFEQMVWKNKTGGGAATKGWISLHEYIICYAKDLTKINEISVPYSDKTAAMYNKKDDKYPIRGHYATWPLDTTSMGDRPNLKYAIIHKGKEIWPKQQWLWSQERVLKAQEENMLLFNKQSDGSYNVRFKGYLKDENGVMRRGKPLSILEGPYTQEGSKDFQSFFSKSIFPFPKPVKLLKNLFDIRVNDGTNNDIILDFFGGSGTLGQAVTELNQEDGGNRKYILVQLPETTDEKSEAYKAGYKKISDITIERNKRVIERIKKKIQNETEKKKEELPFDMAAEQSLKYEKRGLGFKVFKLVKSNFPRVEFAPDPEKTEEENIELLKKYIKDKEAQLVSAFNRDELITEILIKNGFKLNYTLTKQEEFKKNEILFATDGDKETLICLDVIIADETVEYFKTNTDQKLIVLERALDTTKKWNLKHYMGDKFKAF